MVLFLRAGKIDLPLGTEHVGIEIGDPLPAAGGDVEISDRGLNVRIYALPIELRIEIDDIGRGAITELPVEADLLELVEEGTRLANIMRVAELPDQIGRAQQRAFFIIRIRIWWNVAGKPRELDRACNAVLIDGLH